MAALLAAALSAGPVAAQVRGKVEGAAALRVRSGPGEEHAVLDRLTRGASVTVVGAQGSWAVVRLPGGRRGYVLRSFVRLPPGTEWADLETARRTPTPSPTAVPPAETPTRPAVLTAEGGGATPPPVREEIEPAVVATPASQSDCAGLQKQMDRLVVLTEQTYAEVAAGGLSRRSRAGDVDPASSPGAGPILAVAGAGGLLGFVLGTLHGRRQERQRRTRVRL